MLNSPAGESFVRGRITDHADASEKRRRRSAPRHPRRMRYSASASRKDVVGAHCFGNAAVDLNRGKSVIRQMTRPGPASPLLRRYACATLILATLAATAGCGPATNRSPPGPTAATSTPPLAPITGLRPADLLGSWHIESLDGVALPAAGQPRDEGRTPRLAFTRTGYGGTVGCNWFGGLGLLEDDRYYAAPGPQTAMACGELTAREAAVTALLAAAPRITVAAADRLTLNDGARTLILRRDPAVPPAEPAAATADPPWLAGTHWQIWTIDGRPPPPTSDPSGPTLRFEADGWSGRAACATLMSGWRQQGDRIVSIGPVATTQQACPPAQAAVDSALAALIQAGPHVLTGPNGEILIAGGGHWIFGERARGDEAASASADDARLIAGSWQIAAIDGAAPVAGRAASLAFGPASYSGGTGCNSIQGLYLAHGRRLFTHPGPQTEIGCGGELGAQEARINAMLQSSPRIALASDGQIALVDDKGSLRLRRTTAAVPGPSAPPISTDAPTRLHAQLVALDGATLQKRISDPESWLRLSGNRWEAQLAGTALCGALRRRGKTITFFTDARPDPIGPRRMELMRMFNGPARMVLDGNGDLLVAGDEHWLAGRVRRGR